MVGLEQCDARTKPHPLPGAFRYYIPSPFVSGSGSGSTGTGAGAGAGSGSGSGSGGNENGKDGGNGGGKGSLGGVSGGEGGLAGGYVLVQTTHVRSTKSGLKEEVALSTHSLNAPYQ